MNWKGGLALICLVLIFVAWVLYPLVREAVSNIGLVLVVTFIVGLFVAIFVGYFKS